MKKLLHIVAFSLAILAGLALSSCKKSQSAPTIQEQITGKWTIKTAIGNYTVMGVNSKQTTQFTAADYFNFKADGSLTIVENNTTYTGKWNVTNDKLFITGTNYIDYINGFAIPVLNSTDLQLYYTETTSVSTSEQTLNLSK